MLKVTDLAVGQEPEVGHNYLVPCLDISQIPLSPEYATFIRHQDKMVAIPVLGNAHCDPEFRFAGGEYMHYHTDMRFLTEFEFHKIWNTTVAYANNTDVGVNFPIVPVHRMSEVPKPYWHEKMCFRRLGDFSRIEIGFGDDYKVFETEMEKHTLKLDNPICPHHGTSLQGQCVRDGIVTCPLHGATWCATSGKYVRKTQPLKMPTGLADIR